ncbi:hypothetical protein, partial [Enteractinococcus coprophilus]|uniref:hypothetical protein n=1 Tax=Enteractinococcus coprophilus TaxID=1027633 RepID=UPI00319DC839
RSTLSLQRGSSAGIQYHRPKLTPLEEFEHRSGGIDPAEVFSAAQIIAAKLVATGQDPDADDATVDWLVDLVADVGLDTMARMWADAPAVTYGGALWRLYALQQATQRDGDRWAAWYRAGYEAYVSRVIAGASEPPQARDLQSLITKILTGVYAGDFAIALERGGAYARVIAAGQHQHAEQLEDHNPAAAAALEHRSTKLQRTATELELCAAAWRQGRLQTETAERRPTN